ncbi:MerR family transcriptional regulator [Thermodesulfobium sp. 4217-1]|uniref:MerR family transcriptional regulator n=1 Tax=Thermodesulfobium sp. 4217-1 TaxID=3120013 RepID=UPI0032219B64
MENYINLEQISKESNIAESTIRRYISKFEFLFDINNEGRPKRYNKSCIPYLIKINEMYKSGLTTEEIKKSFNDESEPQDHAINLERNLIDKKGDLDDFDNSKDKNSLLLKQISILEEIKNSIKILDDVDMLKKDLYKKEIEIVNLKKENFELKQNLNRLEEKINSYEKDLNKLKKESDNTLMELFNNLKLEQQTEVQKSWWGKIFPK